MNTEIINIGNYFLLDHINNLDFFEYKLIIHFSFHEEISTIFTQEISFVRVKNVPSFLSQFFILKEDSITE